MLNVQVSLLTVEDFQLIDYKTIHTWLKLFKVKYSSTVLQLDVGYLEKAFIVCLEKPVTSQKVYPENRDWLNIPQWSILRLIKPSSFKKPAYLVTTQPVGIQLKISIITLLQGDRSSCFKSKGSMRTAMLTSSWSQNVIRSLIYKDI